MIYMDVSVKMILHPSDGLRPRRNPSNTATRITDAEIETAIADANTFLASYGRGYRLRVVETLTIGGLNQSRGNSLKTEPGYYAVQTSDSAPLTFYYPNGTSGPLIDVLDQNARSTTDTKTAFKWNENAVNIFVPSGWGGGGGIFPANGNAAGFGYFEGWLFLHELGHYYNLNHTFEDDVTDTVTDKISYGRDHLAYELYNAPYANLNATQQTAVNNNSGADNRARIIYGVFYSSLTDPQKAVVDGTPTQANLSSTLYGTTYSNLTATQKAKVDRHLTNPDYVSIDQDSIAVRVFTQLYGNITAAQRNAVDTEYRRRNRNALSAANGLGNSYAALSAWEKEYIDDVFLNLMSYYDPYNRNTTTTRLTELQLDRWTNVANVQRRETVTGRTLFVGGTQTDASAPLGSSTKPYLNITSAYFNTGGSDIILNPAGGDILLFRPGTYYAPAVMNKPLTLRATRNGPVTIQKP